MAIERTPLKTLQLDTRETSELASSSIALFIILGLFIPCILIACCLAIAIWFYEFSICGFRKDGLQGLVQKKPTKTKECGMAAFIHQNPPSNTAVTVEGQGIEVTGETDSQRKPSNVYAAPRPSRLFLTTSQERPRFPSNVYGQPRESILLAATMQ